MSILIHDSDFHEILLCHVIPLGLSRAIYIYKHCVMQFSDNSQILN